MLKTYAVATGNYDTTQAAAEILEKGGNAYDAVLAALFMSFVTEPLLSSPGGGGYLLAHPKDQKPKIFDFFAQTPHNKNLKNKDFYPIHGDFGAAEQEFHIGMASIAIPGVPAGIFASHKHYSSMTLPEIACAAIKKAKEGMLVDKLHAEVIHILTPILNHSIQAKNIFINAKGQLLKQDEKKNNLQLAQFLENLASQPEDWFYFDTPAANIVKDMRQHKGLLSKSDFENYTVQIRKPLIANINGWEIMTNSLPTSGGQLIIEQLKHAQANSEKNQLHKTVQAMAYADKLKSKYDFQSSKGTSHMSVVDAEGNVASLTISNGEGSGYVVPNSGFMLNNFLGEEDINTGGFFKFEENTRMASMMSPSIIEKDNNRIALGTGGSNRIKTAMFQVMWHIIAENQTLNQAVNQPRLHLESNKLDIEHGFSKEALETLALEHENIIHWQRRSLYFGGINAVQHGMINLAIGDARRNGVGLVKQVY